MTDEPNRPSEPRPYEPGATFPPPPPPPGIRFPGPPDAGKRRGRGPLFIALAVLVVAGLGAAAFLVTRSDDEPDPEELLDTAQNAVGDAESFQFTLTGEGVVAVGDVATSTAVTTRFTGGGEWTADNWRMEVDNGRSASESIVAGDSWYDRVAADIDGLDAEKWLEYETLEGSDQEVLDELEFMGDAPVEDVQAQLGESVSRSVCEDILAIAANQMLFIGGGFGPLPELQLPDATAGDLVGDPTAFTYAIEQMGQPTLVEESDDVTTLAASLKADDQYVEAFGRAIPDGRVELDLGDDDLPTALRYEVSQGESSSKVEVELTGWNASIEVEAPADDEIDATPWIDEEGLASLTDVAPVAPTNTPAGWELTTWSPDQLVEDGFAYECEAIMLQWDEPLAEDASDEELLNAGYLNLTLFSSECALDVDTTPFEPSGPGGPSRITNLGFLQVQVGDTVVEVGSSLSSSELDAVLATLAPVDIDTLIAAAATGAA